MMSIIALMIAINLASSLKQDCGYTVVCQKEIHFSILGISGVFVIASQGLSYFGIYRLMVSSSPRQAHHLRSGIIGYLGFGVCGKHLIKLIGIWLNQVYLFNNDAFMQSIIHDCFYYFALPIRKSVIAMYLLVSLISLANLYQFGGLLLFLPKEKQLKQTF